MLQSTGLSIHPSMHPVASTHPSIQPPTLDNEASGLSFAVKISISVVPGCQPTPRGAQAEVAQGGGGERRVCGWHATADSGRARAGYKDRIIRLVWMEDADRPRTHQVP